MSNQDEKVEIPKGQKFFDNIFWLLALSILLSTVLYNVWGLIELLTLPPAP